MNTEHGYHVDGTRLQSAANVEACGGPAHCNECKDDSSKKIGELKLREISVGR